MEWQTQPVVMSIKIHSGLPKDAWIVFEAPNEFKLVPTSDLEDDHFHNNWLVEPTSRVEDKG